MALFEGYEKKNRQNKRCPRSVWYFLVEECKTICEEKGFDPIPSPRISSPSALRMLLGPIP